MQLLLKHIFNCLALTLVQLIQCYITEKYLNQIDNNVSHEAKLRGHNL